MKRRQFVQTILIGSCGSFFLNPKNISAAFSMKDTIRLKMIYNNIGEANGLDAKWGLSIWVEYSDWAILFDAGGMEDVFWSNFSNSGLDLKKLSGIVVSHDHWDHTKGIEKILSETDYKPELFVVKKDLINFRKKYTKAKVTGIDKTLEIRPGLWSTGQLLGNHRSGELYEQSLILVQNESVYLITGCSHSGIAEMVEHVIKLYKGKSIELVIGGFHLMQKSEEEILTISEKLKKSGVKNISPSHCTGDLAISIFKKKWGDNFINFNLGDEIAV